MSAIRVLCWFMCRKFWAEVSVEHAWACVFSNFLNIQSYKNACDLALTCHSSGIPTLVFFS